MFFIIDEFGMYMSFPSKFLKCVTLKSRSSTLPLYPSTSIISPISKGRFNAKIIPAKKFSPISLNANPKTIALIPAPAIKLLAIPPNPTIFNAIIRIHFILLQN
mgnify:CR=1 FL=1